MRSLKRFSCAVVGLGLVACGGGASTAGGSGEGTAGAGNGGSSGGTAATGGGSSGGATGSATAGTAGVGIDGGDSGGMAGTSGSAGAAPDAGSAGGSGAGPDAGAGGSAGMEVDAGPPPDPAGVVGFAFAGLPAANSAYAPAAKYSFNASGGDVSVERTAVGTYRVTFDNLDPPMRSAQVTAYDHDGFCSVTSHGSDQANVRCYDNDGELANAAFSLAAFGPAKTGASVVAYAFAGNPSAPQYGANAHYSYNIADASMTARRSAAGTYTLDFNGLSLATGNVQVTAVDSHHHCSIDGWAGNTVETTCYDETGTPADTEYLVQVIKTSDSQVAILGYAYSTSSSDASTDLTSGPSTFNATGGSVVSERTDTGAYRVTFQGADFSTSHPHVTSRTAGKHCSVTQWAADWVRLQCWDDSGAASNSLFNALVVE